MTRMREELNKDLELVQSTKDSTSSSSSSNSSSSVSSLKQQEAYLKTQIKHMSEQIKCVGFLLMQAQLGLEAINDEMSFHQKKSPPRPPPPQQPPPLPANEPIGDIIESSVEVNNDLESLDSMSTDVGGGEKLTPPPVPQNPPPPPPPELVVSNHDESLIQFN